MSWFYYTARAIVRFLLFLLIGWQVIGTENVPREGPVIIVANHVSLADPPLIGISIKRRMMMMAKEELFRNPITGYFIRGFGAFPVHRSRFDRRAVRRALEVLNDGMALVIFPEGKRASDGRLQSGFAGAALIASLSSAPILPVGITGTYKLLDPIRLMCRPRVIIKIGKPFYLPQSDKLTREELSRNTAGIMERISEVLPPENQGIGK